MLTIREPVEFVWDKGNKDKNWIKHEVTDRECEEVFFDEEKKTFKDELHSKGEERFRVIGKTERERLLFVVFTARKGRIRIISARDVNKKEVKLYEEKTHLT